MHHLRWLSFTALLLTTGALAQAAGPALPGGWIPLPAPTLSGAFLHEGNADTAVLTADKDGYGLVVVPDAASGAEARVVKTFHDIAANPPQLSLIKPGNYQPLCHGGGTCPPVSIASEAIGLCFGEASCEILYFDGKAFRDIAITD
ncbi:hypothetical protein GTP55_23850 [Duganella sp. FT109W]|uniref:Uncharacterized protein n=1 Tax=Duganella margarita TaxID=2692170 RepID=A0ABW9WMF6_9BURK|nr:hypothetical protein [Duganella margarita]MYN42382.1 hypothetical protein [Duganella margarita]